MSIYTRTGDFGMTGLHGATRVPKCHPQIELCGTIDELSSWLGLVCTEKLSDQEESWLEKIQSDLMTISAEIVSSVQTSSKFTSEKVVFLEKTIDSLEKELPALDSFILPGGSRVSALLHVARTVCRRAERCFVHCFGKNACGCTSVTPPPSPQSNLLEFNPLQLLHLKYLNRLSYLFFVLARSVNKRLGQKEKRWTL